ncbi:MAG: DUF1289 domain-containing protein [Ignavibacteriae bacterium HGW-Ignavibacteriae-3]|nr:MAG: DUF1289 domain-containing protein [Ignavibacteriae bacterium HGW-Ignavibacteriae-3]
MYSGQNQISPCNNKCIMDPITNYCRGCFRTIEEIVQWSHLASEEKKIILQQAEFRKSSRGKNKS